MALFVVLVIGGLALAAVLYPLLARLRLTEPPAALGGVNAVQELLDRRDTLLRAMRELEYDRQLGNLVGEDHERLRDAYEGEAIVVLKALEIKAEGIAEELEANVAAARQGDEVSARQGAPS